MQTEVKTFWCWFGSFRRGGAETSRSPVRFTRVSAEPFAGRLLCCRHRSADPSLDSLSSPF